jgi:hypothetical protein
MPTRRLWPLWREEMLTDALRLLAGKKTHIIAVALIAYELLGYLLGKSDGVDMKTVLEGLGLATLRAGIAKGR